MQSRALIPVGPFKGFESVGTSASIVVDRQDVLDRIELVRVHDRVLLAAGTVLPPDIRSLDAIHLPTASLLGRKLGELVTYDGRLASAASQWPQGYLSLVEPA